MVLKQISTRLIIISKCSAYLKRDKAVTPHNIATYYGYAHPLIAVSVGTYLHAYVYTLISEQY